MGKKTKREEIRETPDIQEKREEGHKTLEESDLMAKLKEKEKESAENYDKYIRAIAELENYKKRAIREKSDSIRYGNENLIKDILPLVDGMDRALQHAGNSGDFETFRKGVTLVISRHLEKD